MNPDGCHMCGGMDHWRELCKLNQPAPDLAEHQRRIALFIDRYADKLISLEMKREFVRQEHEMWNSRKRTKAA